ncbi:MAG: D-alanyl-D-alanine carboxypeptidase, partial [Limosilactobacillus reuteri]|nr:D-alanyl-D-alanine carboxypeptidase [Limosilactobacillus reuteri]
STGTFAGRRIILVALHTKGEWNDQSKMQQDFYNKLIDEYQPVEIKKASDFSTKLTSVKVKNGKNKTNLKLTKKTTVWLPKNMKLQATKLTLRVQGDNQKQLTAPIKKNQQVGSIELHIPGLPDFNIPVSASRSVAEKSMF